MWLSYLLTFILRVVVGAHPRWLGSKPSPALRIYYANHTSHMDTLALWCALPSELRAKTRPVAARDYWSGAGFKSYVATRGFNVLFIERAPANAVKANPELASPGQGKADPANSEQTPAENNRRERDPLTPLHDALQRGESLIIFPEGTRRAQALPSPFKSGIFHLAAKFPEVELIPVYLDNLYRSMPKGTFLPVPLTCSVRFGAPLIRIAGETKDAFLERARQAVVDLA
jgi:1-acyl-sn-glycerol-3-phosphate acyltransferase